MLATFGLLILAQFMSDLCFINISSICHHRLSSCEAIDHTRGAKMRRGHRGGEFFLRIYVHNYS